MKGDRSALCEDCDLPGDVTIQRKLEYGGAFPVTGENNG